MNGLKRGRTWRIDDASARARAHPYTFWKPSSSLVEKLRPGDFVKLIFLLTEPGPDEPNAERMWVEVTEKECSSFFGRLDSQPEYILELKSGSEIKFESKHIIDASIEDPVQDPTLKWSARCFATNRILIDGGKVGFFYRESPDRAEDSGWRFLCGDESEEYMDSADNIQLVSLGAVLSCDDRMVSLLDHPAPIAFQWDQQSQSFVVTEMLRED
jgi:hypothetical protein